MEKNKEVTGVWVCDKCGKHETICNNTFSLPTSWFRGLTENVYDVVLCPDCLSELINWVEKRTNNGL